MLTPVTQIWGGAELIEGEPRCPFLTDAIYVPWTSRLAWGLFDANGTVCLEGLSFTAEVRPEAPLSCAKIAEQPLIPYTGAIGSSYDQPLIYVGKPNFHFGHFLVETLPRLWAVAGLRRADPSLKLLIHDGGHTDGFLQLPWVASVLGALGLERQDFVWFDQPTRLREVYVPATALEPQAYAFSLLREFFRRIGDAITANLPPDDDQRPVYFTKTMLAGGVQRIANEHRMLPILEACGVHIIAPERLTLAEQIRLFATGRTILGTASSAFHVCILSRGRPQLLLLQPTGHLNANHILCQRLSETPTTFLTQDGGMAHNADPQFLTTFTLADPHQAAFGLLQAAEID